MTYDEHLYNDDFRRLKPGMILVARSPSKMSFPWSLRVMTDFEAQKACGWHEEDWGYKTNRDMPAKESTVVLTDYTDVFMYLGGVDQMLKEI